MSRNLFVGSGVVDLTHSENYIIIDDSPTDIDGESAVIDLTSSNDCIIISDDDDAPKPVMQSSEISSSSQPSKEMEQKRNRVKNTTNESKEGSNLPDLLASLPVGHLKPTASTQTLPYSCYRESRNRIDHYFESSKKIEPTTSILNEDTSHELPNKVAGIQSSFSSRSIDDNMPVCTSARQLENGTNSSAIERNKKRKQTSLCDYIFENDLVSPPKIGKVTTSASLQLNNSTKKVVDIPVITLDDDYDEITAFSGVNHDSFLDKLKQSHIIKRESNLLVGTLSDDFEVGDDLQLPDVLCTKVFTTTSDVAACHSSPVSQDSCRTPKTLLPDEHATRETLHDAEMFSEQIDNEPSPNSRDSVKSFDEGSKTSGSNQDMLLPVPKDAIMQICKSPETTQVVNEARTVPVIDLDDFELPDLDVTPFNSNIQEEFFPDRDNSTSNSNIPEVISPSNVPEDVLSTSSNISDVDAPSNSNVLQDLFPCNSNAPKLNSSIGNLNKTQVLLSSNPEMLKNDLPSGNVKELLLSRTPAKRTFESVSSLSSAAFESKVLSPSTVSTGSNQQNGFLLKRRSFLDPSCSSQLAPNCNSKMTFGERKQSENHETIKSEQTFKAMPLNLDLGDELPDLEVLEVGNMNYQMPEPSEPTLFHEFDEDLLEPHVERKKICLNLHIPGTRQPWIKQNCEQTDLPLLLQMAKLCLYENDEDEVLQKGLNHLQAYTKHVGHPPVQVIPKLLKFLRTNRNVQLTYKTLLLFHRFGGINKEIDWWKEITQCIEAFCLNDAAKPVMEHLGCVLILQYVLLVLKEDAERLYLVPGVFTLKHSLAYKHLGDALTTYRACALADWLATACGAFHKYSSLVDVLSDLLTLAVTVSRSPLTVATHAGQKLYLRYKVMTSDWQKELLLNLRCNLVRYKMLQPFVISDLGLEVPDIFVTYPVTCCTLLEPSRYSQQLHPDCSLEELMRVMKFTVLDYCVCVRGQLHLPLHKRIPTKLPTSENEILDNVDVLENHFRTLYSAEWDEDLCQSTFWQLRLLDNSCCG